MSLTAAFQRPRPAPRCRDFRGNSPALFCTPEDGRGRPEAALDGDRDEAHRVAGVYFQKGVEAARVLQRVDADRPEVAFLKKPPADE